MSDRAERLVELLPARRPSTCCWSRRCVNVRYMTGYTGTNGLALVGPQTRVFVTDFRYVEQAAERGRPELRAQSATSRAARGDRRRRCPPGELRLGFEDEHMTVRQHARLRELLPERVELVAAGGLVERLRAVKEPGEIERIRARRRARRRRRCAQMLEQGLAGRTERERRRRARARRCARAAPTGPASTRSSPPARTARCRTPRRATSRSSAGELVVIDWGAEVDGYCSDCTRTVAAGEPRTRRARSTSSCWRRSWPGSTRSAPGAGGREVDAAARAVIDAAGHGDHFGHGLGHGVGIEIHEAPRLSLRSERRARGRQRRHGRARRLPRRAGSGSGSRTWWSSATAAARSSPRSTRSSRSSTDGRSEFPTWDTF